MAITVDAVEVTYLDTNVTGYLAAPDTSVICDGDGSALAFISIATLGTSTVDGSNIIVM